MRFQEYLMKLWCDGVQDKEMADAFGVSESTVCHWRNGTHINGMRSVGLLWSGIRKLTPEMTVKDAYRMCYGASYGYYRSLFDLIRERMFELGLSYEELSEKSGLSMNALHGIKLKKTSNFKDDGRGIALAEALQVPVRTLEKAGGGYR